MTEIEAIELFKEQLTLIKEHYAGEVKDYEEALEIGIQALEKQINGCWVPCKHRLPEEINKYYLVTCRSVICGEFEQFTTTSYFSTFSSGDKSWEIEEEHGNNWMVTAWQPLPKPYKEGER